MKCPYCGKENTRRLCIKCRAEIPFTTHTPAKKPEKSEENAEKRKEKEGRE